MRDDDDSLIEVASEDALDCRIKSAMGLIGCLIPQHQLIRPGEELDDRRFQPRPFKITHVAAIVLVQAFGGLEWHAEMRGDDLSGLGRLRFEAGDDDGRLIDGQSVR